MYSHLSCLLYTLEEGLHLTVHDALAGDPLAVSAAFDLAEERGIPVNPFEVGKAYYIETITLYYVGEVVEKGPTHVRLKTASWVHWTGRKSVLFKHKRFDKKLFDDSEAKPRTEYVGTFTVALAGINGWEEWPVENLPTESIQ